MPGCLTGIVPIISEQHNSAGELTFRGSGKVRQGCQDVATT